MVVQRATRSSHKRKEASHSYQHRNIDLHLPPSVRREYGRQFMWIDRKRLSFPTECGFEASSAHQPHMLGMHVDDSWGQALTLHRWKCRIMSIHYTVPVHPRPANPPEADGIRIGSWKWEWEWEWMVRSCKGSMDVGGIRPRHGPRTQGPVLPPAKAPVTARPISSSNLHGDPASRRSWVGRHAFGSLAISHSPGISCSGNLMLRGKGPDDPSFFPRTIQDRLIPQEEILDPQASANARHGEVTLPPYAPRFSCAIGPSKEWPRESHP
jgi:hypothetical protein